MTYKNDRQRIYQIDRQYYIRFFYFFCSTEGFLPNHLATTGVRATVGGNLIGDAALCTAYAIAAVPVLVAATDDFIPTFSNKKTTSTPDDINI